VNLDKQLGEINWHPNVSNVWAWHCLSCMRDYFLMPKMAIMDPGGGLAEGDEVIPSPEDVGVVPITAMQSKCCRIKFQLDSRVESHEVIIESTVKSSEVTVVMPGGRWGVDVGRLSIIIVLGLACAGSLEGFASV